MLLHLLTLQFHINPFCTLTVKHTVEKSLFPLLAAAKANFILSDFSPRTR